MLKASIDHEYAFADVRKTVDATEEEYDRLSDSVKQMSTEVAASAEDIAEVMSIAGQLGIENEHLAEFTRTMIDLSLKPHRQRVLKWQALRYAGR